ncbi:DUF2800 domain-containing protein [Kushneria phosphatilytica]|uniref:DUF2800 domain-containing protein n=1 Tax=Kushneria phosphatilytica TaxID=657387 RepID=A0A1S1NZ46_9GAMM|nr:DUF2800 domain-containing protein [Kushneria phosphatilytica]OHV12143.1 hypothetical protein BH688_05680 [Kushneria phosphatilytica]QEL11335.1 DUF2800 domain-containing protein [Kushneria phosphatilytica]
MIEHGQRAHSRLSPSSAHRWMKCPRSFWWEPDFPDSTSPHAEEGTAAHELSEKALAEGKDARSYEGQTFNGYKASEEMVTATQLYIDAINGTPGEHYLEERLEHPNIAGMFGTADDVADDAPTLYVSDLKYGKGVQVEAPGNAQLRIYGLMALHRFGVLNDYETVVTRIHQPRLNHTSGEELTVDELETWEQQNLIPAINRLDDEPETMVAGDHCRWCKAAAVCPELARVNMAAAEGMFEDDAPALPTDITEPELPSPESLTRDQIVAILGHRKQIENWLRAIETHVSDALQAGEEVPGYKMVAGRTQRKWEDEGQALEAARSAAWDDEILTTPRLKTPAQLEKAIGKERFRELMENHVSRAPGKPTLAPESDKRPALELRNPESLFDD